jgi:hypothetical protein
MAMRSRLFVSPANRSGTSARLSAICGDLCECDRPPRQTAAKFRERRNWPSCSSVQHEREKRGIMEDHAMRKTLLLTTAFLAE